MNRYYKYFLAAAAMFLLSCSDSPTDSDITYTDNDPRGAVKITVPHIADYSISSETDLDWYRVELEAGTEYKFTTISETDLDTDFYLYGPGNATGATGDSIAYDDDGGEDSQPMIEYSCATSGYYYLRVSEYTNDPVKKPKQMQTTGDYTLVVNTADALFAKTFGGIYDEWANSIAQTPDGGYIIASYTLSYGAGGTDALLTKIQPDGTEEWSKAFGGTGNDWAMGVLSNSDGSIVVIGSTESYGAGQSDMWFIKTDSHGNQIWSKTFGGTGYDYGRDVEKTSDGGFIIAGYTSSWGSGSYDAMLIKVDESGDDTWSKVYGGTNLDLAYSVVQTTDGGYAFSGEYGYTGNGTGNVWAVKTDSAGSLSWSNTYGTGNESYSNEICQTSDGGYIMACITDFTEDYSTDSEILLVKTDSYGAQSWTRVWGGTNSDYCKSIKEVEEGGYIFAGQTYSYGVNADVTSDIWIVRTDTNGIQSWASTYGGTYNEWANCIIQTNDGGFIFGGGTVSYGAGGSDILIVKTDSDGTTTKLGLTPSKANGGTIEKDRNNGSPL